MKKGIAVFVFLVLGLVQMGSPSQATADICEGCKFMGRLGRMCSIVGGFGYECCATGCYEGECDCWIPYECKICVDSI